MNPYEPLEVAWSVASVLDQLNVPYYIGGSAASGQHGIPRSTRDVDLCADLKVEHISPFVSALQEDFYVPEDMIRQAIHNRSSFNLIHFKQAYKVDVFIPGASPLDKQGLLRVQRQRFSPDHLGELAILSVEDTILQKLRWFQLGNQSSSQQWQDLLGILKVQAEKVDIPYLRQWAQIARLDALLQKLLSAAGLSSS
jgi:hypothetical protein